MGFKMMWLFLIVQIVKANPEPEMIPKVEMSLMGRTAPFFSKSEKNGLNFNLQDQKGKIVILSFWASWCSPCRYELPELYLLQQKMPDVKVVTINVDKHQKDARGFLSKVDFDLPILWDHDAKIMGQYQVLSMPTIFLIDQNGTVKYKKVGYSKTKKLVDLEQQIAELR